MGYGYRNHILEILNKTESKKMKRLFCDKNSRLWNEYSFKDKQYTLERITNDILELAPFGDNRLLRLVRFVEKQMNITLWDKRHYRWTKPHRGSLRKHLNKHFSNYRDSKQKKLKDEREMINAIEDKVIDINLKIAINNFDIKLTKIIYDNKTPRDNSVNTSLQNAHQLMIFEYEEQGLYELVQQLKNNPPMYKSTFTDVSNKIKDIFLKENDALPMQELEEALTVQIGKVKRFSYPTKNDTYPKD